jgi:methylthioxylose transferase
VSRGRPYRVDVSALRKDLCAAAVAVALFVAAVVFAYAAYAHPHEKLSLGWPPMYAHWEPHVGPGSPAALGVAVLAVWWGPRLARRLPWRALLWSAWGGAMAWSWSLALVDGWYRGVAQRLTTAYEYLQPVGDVHDVGATLRTFTDHILLHSPHHWPPHVAGHPPGALLTFVALDRIGLGGGAWAAVFVITVASSTAAAVLVTLRALCGQSVARRAAPFVVLAPAVVWTAVSADGYYAGVSSWALALLAPAATRTARAPRAAALGAGLLFGLTCYLSYGLVLVAVLALAVLLLARTLRPVPYVLVGMAPWVAAFTAAGFWWYDGYSTLVVRYYQGAAAHRPYAYFVWANLAANVPVIGLATVAALRRAGAALPDGLRAVLRRTPTASPGVPRGTGTTGAEAAPPAGGAVGAPLGAEGMRHAGTDGLRTASTRAPAAVATPDRWPGDLPAPAPAARPAGSDALVVLVAAAACAVLAADLSGMSKAETARIWLSFTFWLIPACALLPARSVRWWLAAQAVLTLAVNHLLFTGW